MYTGEGARESSEMSRARSGADVEGFFTSRDRTIADKKSSVQGSDMRR